MAEESTSVEAGVPQAQNPDLVNQVFTLFKGYLSSQLDAQGKILQSKSKIDKDAAGLKYKGNRKQFELNADLEEILDSIDSEASNAERVRALVADAKQVIKRRQKLIRIADKSKDGWAVVEEYESDDLASIRPTRNGSRKQSMQLKRNESLQKLRCLSQNASNLILVILSFFAVWVVELPFNAVCVILCVNSH